MSGKESSQAADVYRLQQEVDVLKEQLAVLTRAVLRNKKVSDATENLLRVFGEYRGPDNRKVPALITAVFPRAGTCDIFLFDNSYSGGKHELTGIELGLERGEMMPYLVDCEEEGEPANESLVAS